MIHLSSTHPDDPHFIGRSGWLRAAVLGANDGIVSVAALVAGVAASGAGPQAIPIAGVAGLTAGAMSMAAGEYISVSAQRDIERADMRRERRALKDNPEAELAELAAIWEHRGLTAATARQVAQELHDHDALGAHMRDEIGLTEQLAASPLQAAFASAATFLVAGAVPVLAAIFAPPGQVGWLLVAVTLAALAGLGALGAWLGGADRGRAMLRVLLWGGLAMAITAAVGRLFHVAL